MKRHNGIIAWLIALTASTLAMSILLATRIDDLAGQLDQARAQIATVSAKAAGTHRDLITCADLQALGLETLLDINLNTDATGTISAVPDQQPIQLPQHCINQ